ncbi:VOC family protein [Arthrobacter cryoconiti]|uniref:VOC family protein n=1 Tax=Arthrobacter cryoconiti TaxID=748907 RepID=A0ABV8R120_9MICC|nr:VOC family protein [Arthrobacter cryoconiti]MCC9068621.1 VOC family protein [Arthrobacter cryoconiti]
MATQLSPYINFCGNAREAMEFYHSVFGGELTLSTFADFHASEDPAEADLIMHGALTTEGGLALMGSDKPKSMAFTPGNNFSVSLNGDDEAQLRGYWDQLSDGDAVSMPLEKSMWGDTFGMCVDKFGVDWLVNIVAGS